MRLRVLLVDDEPNIRAIYRRLLEHDFDVVPCASASEALGHVRAGERFDAFVIDLVMPGLTGADLFARLPMRDQRRVVFVTGGPPSYGMRVFGRDAMLWQPILQKPFPIQHLCDALHAVARGPVAARSGVYASVDADDTGTWQTSRSSA